MDETNWSSDFFSDIFSLGFDIYFFEKKDHHADGLPHTKVETSHFFALESTSYVNKCSKTEILAFCYWHN